MVRTKSTSVRATNILAGMMTETATGNPDRRNEAHRLGSAPAAADQSAQTRGEALKAAAYLPQLVPSNPLPFRRTIRRAELRQIVPLADSTIYDMERRGEFPRRFNLTARCVVWDLTEVEAWITARREASNMSQIRRAPSPDVRQRKRRPVRVKASSAS